MMAEIVPLKLPSGPKNGTENTRLVRSELFSVMLYTVLSQEITCAPEIIGILKPSVILTSGTCASNHSIWKCSRWYS